ncbi:hypothetical protein BDR05DRAFT_1047149 [Suillus weaverae]|nr:hypothetical protein BDR05DRAFT_1047149 [Suillus weaverae]
MTIPSDKAENECLQKEWTLQDRSIHCPTDGKVLQQKFRLRRRTGIVLDGSSSSATYHVDQRMTWAAACTMTREEDAAYCLLGISELALSD